MIIVCICILGIVGCGKLELKDDEGIELNSEQLDIIGNSLKFSIMLEREVEDSRVDELRDVLEMTKDVLMVEYIAPEETWENFKNECEEMNYSSQSIDESNMYITGQFIIYVKQSSNLGEFYSFLEGLEGIRDVTYSNSLNHQNIVLSILLEEDVDLSRIEEMKNILHMTEGVLSAHIVEMKTLWEILKAEYLIVNDENELMEQENMKGSKKLIIHVDLDSQKAVSTFVEGLEEVKEISMSKFLNNINVENLESSRLTVMFDNGLEQEHIEEIGKAIMERSEVEYIEFTSAEEAWEEFKEDYFGEGDEAETEEFQENPLANSASYTVYLKEYVDVKELVDFISRLDGVRAVNQEI